MVLDLFSCQYILLIIRCTHLFLSVYKIISLGSISFSQYVHFNSFSYQFVLDLITKIITGLLQKHAYSNILTISPPNTENFQIIISDIFHISAQNINCGCSLEPPVYVFEQK